MGDDLLGGDRLLTTAEVGALFRVDTATVARWIRAGRVASTPTPGGHHRVRESDVRSFLEGGTDGHAHEDHDDQH